MKQQEEQQTGGSEMQTDARIYVAGHRGLVGSAITRGLKRMGYGNLILRSQKELDLMRQEQVEAFFAKERPEFVVLAAAKVGGIWANNIYPAEFIYCNLAIETNVIHWAYKYGVKKLLFLGSSCIYPKLCAQPMKEEHLLSGYLEPTNQPYAIAKIAGIEMCRSYNRQYGTNFISVMPTNLYGQGDNFHLERSHVLPALIRKFHLAKLAAQRDFEAIRLDEDRFGAVPEDIKASLGTTVILWGTGEPRREFLYVDDLADACVYLMNRYGGSEIVNIGTGRDITIKALADLVAKVVGYEGPIFFDSTKPDGTPQKLLDVSRLHSLGWQAKTSLEEGIRKTYEWYLQQAHGGQ